MKSAKMYFYYCLKRKFILKLKIAMKCQTLLGGKPFYFGKQKTTLFVLKAETNLPDSPWKIS